MRERKKEIEEEDPDNLWLKVPRESTAISDPSSIDSFVDGLLLEGDEVRLAQIGPVEAMKKAIALNYQVKFILTISLLLLFCFGYWSTDFLFTNL